jgi:hypothetical protein
MRLIGKFLESQSVFSVNLCALYGLAVGVPTELSDGSFRTQYHGRHENLLQQSDDEDMAVVGRPYPGDRLPNRTRSRSSHNPCSYTRSRAKRAYSNLIDPARPRIGRPVLSAHVE